MIPEKPDVEKNMLGIESIWMNSENRIIADIMRRIRKTGEITSTADYQINRLIEMGKSREEIEKIIKESLNATWPEMFELYDRVAEWQYVRNEDVYLMVNNEFIPFEKNQSLLQACEAIKIQTKEKLENIAQSYGFSVLVNGKREFTELAKYYQKYMDEALLDVIDGGMDYGSVMRRAVKEMTDSGLRFIDYDKGRSERAHVAVRRNMVTALGQITGIINDHNAKKLGTDYFEVDWHANARPEHAEWQGKVYSRRELTSVCGLGEVTGLCGANCYHNYYPFVKGVSVRQWSDEWIEEKNAEESKLREWNGKEYNAYELTQVQRKLERNMRAQRSKIVALKIGGEEKNLLDAEKIRYRAQLAEYRRFTRETGLIEQKERIYIDMLGRVI